MVVVLTILIGIGLFLWKVEMGVGYFIEIGLAVYVGWVFSKFEMKMFIKGLIVVSCVFAPFAVYMYDEYLGLGGQAGLIAAVLIGAWEDRRRKGWV